jgi:hypothetical protein
MHGAGVNHLGIGCRLAARGLWHTAVMRVIVMIHKSFHLFALGCSAGAVSLGK